MENYMLTMTSSVLSLIFIFIGLIFAIFKEKACILIAGFNFKSKEEREEFDQLKLSVDQRNFFLICGGIFLAGTGVTALWSQAAFWIFVVIWLVYFFSQVHLNPERAFEKYKRK